MNSNVNETQKGTSLRESTSFEPSSTKNCRPVIFHTFAQKPSVSGFASNVVSVSCCWHIRAKYPLS